LEIIGMDLEEFITQTIRAIAGATTTLQEKLEPKGVTINPPASFSGDPGLVDPQGTAHRLDRVQNVEFDVAVTASSETTGGGGGKIKVMPFEIGGEAKHGQSAEQVNRVRFSIALALPPSEMGKRNRERNDAKGGSPKRGLKGTP
jgi:hypothetical protein